jgi:hypothetical protein
MLALIVFISEAFVFSKSSLRHLIVR